MAQVWYTKSISLRTEYFGVKLASLIFTLECILPSLILYAQNKLRYRVKLASLIFTLECILPSLILYAQNKLRYILLAAD